MARSTNQCCLCVSLPLGPRRSHGPSLTFTFLYRIVCGSWRGLCLQTLWESEPVSLGIMHLRVSTRTDTIRGWPGAWGLEAKDKKPSNWGRCLNLPCHHPLLPLLAPYQPAYQPIHLSTPLPIYNPPTCPPIHSFTHPPTYPSTYPSIQNKDPQSGVIQGPSSGATSHRLAGLGKVPSPLRDSLSQFYKKELA